MTPDDFPDLARLWQEQVDPAAERARFGTLADQLRRSARRRRLLDFAFGGLGLLLILAVLTHPGSTLFHIGVAASVLVIGWSMWKRQRLAAAALAMDESDPRSFLNDAIAGARAEVRFTTWSLYATIPFFALWFYLIAAQEIPKVAGIIPNALGPFVYLAAIAILYFFFIRANLRLREQQRRLEAMGAEYEAEEARDLTPEG